MRKKRNHIVAAGAAVVIVAGTALSLVFALRPTERSSPGLGAFAGYFVPVARFHSDGARWQVPAVDNSAGVAATLAWIGVQAEGNAGGSAFLQIGTVSARSGSGGHGYWAFWSDNRREYSLQRLFAVSPGDVVEANIVRSQGQFRLSVSDRTRNRHARIVLGVVTAGAEAAEWYEEDPARDYPDRGAGYTRLRLATRGEIAFDRVRLNGRAPPSGALESQWMTAGSASLAPGRLQNDGFVIASRIMSLTAARYVKVMNAEEVGNGLLVGVLSSHVDASGIARLRTALEPTLAAVDRVLGAPTWSTAGAGGCVRAVQDANQRLAAIVGSLGPSLSTAEVTAVRRAVASVLSADDLARTRLGAPDVFSTLPGGAEPVM